MKKIIKVSLVALVMMFCASFTSKAQDSGFGIIGGATFNTRSLVDLDESTLTQWHLGAAYTLDLPLGFALQPALMYNVKGTKTTSVSSYSAGYLEVPVALQWGIDLLILRPYLEVAPFVGYALNNVSKATVGDAIVKTKNEWDGLNRFECGVGLGGGLQVWRLQLSARYNWNFERMYQKGDKFVDYIEESIGSARFGGVTFSLAVFF